MKKQITKTNMDYTNLLIHAADFMTKNGITSISYDNLKDIIEQLETTQEKKCIKCKVVIKHPRRGIVLIVIGNIQVCLKKLKHFIRNEKVK